jgi:kumamolisin
MGLTPRPIRACAIVIASVAMTAMTGAFATSAMAAPTAASSAAATMATPFTAISSRFTATSDKVTGPFSRTKMSVEISLAPRNQAALNSLLKAIYTKGSKSYQHFLAKGQFSARFAPTAAARAAVASYLRSRGLTVGQTSSPFLVRATGSSQQISAAFRTSLRTYQNSRGTSYFANSSAAQLPSSLAAGVQGVIGLTDTARLHANVKRLSNTIRPAKPARSGGATASCEGTYPTAQQLFDFFNLGTPFNPGYGGSPGCNGLTPSQLNSLYGAPHVGARGKGKGVTLAVFELSAYQQSDVAAYAHQFFGPNYTPKLQNILVDGGPLNPICPAGDTCQPASGAFAGDVEVDADIETQLALAPDVKKIQVYESPNDVTGQVNLDLYGRIANDDTADSISSSWGACESDAGGSLIQAENTIFEQMALQGQSMFSASGDTGAFTCIRGSGSTAVETGDPSSQPWVTGVGGTSFENDNPGTNEHPAYPAGVETVWNIDNLCNASADEGGFPGFFWCAATGAGGGGNSQFWGRPFYQIGPHVSNAFSTTGNGTTQCSLARVGAPCREVPDISANADELTPYAEFCTANANTPGSACGFSSAQTPPGWFGIGGTSLSSPVWSAIFADRDSFTGHRTGNVNPLLYLLYNLAPGHFFHDITGIGAAQAVATNNGVFPTTRGYDMATGIGTPKMAALITG